MGIRRGFKKGFEGSKHAIADASQRVKQKFEERRARKERQLPSYFLRKYEGKRVEEMSPEDFRDFLNARDAEFQNFQRKHRRGQRTAAATIVGTAAGAFYAGSPLPDFIRDTTDWAVNTTRATKKLGEALARAVYRKDERELRKYFQQHEDFSSQLGPEMQKLKQHLGSRESFLLEAKQSYEELARICKSAPGYDTETVKKLTSLRNKLLEYGTKFKDSLTGKESDAEIRNSKEYAGKYDALVKLLPDVHGGRQTALKEILGALESIGSMTDRELQQIKEAKSDLEKLAKTYNEATQVIHQYEGLTPQEIQHMEKNYRQVAEVGQHYQKPKTQYGDMAALSAGVALTLVGAYAGVKLRDALGYRVKIPPPQKRPVQKGLEGKLTLFFLFSSFILFFFFINTITGYTALPIEEGSQKSFTAFVAISILASCSFILRKVYKGKTSGKRR